MNSTEGGGVVVVGGGEVNGIHPVAPSPRLTPVPATIVINAASPAPAVRALSLRPNPTNSPPGDPAQISATRLLELMSGKQQSPKNEAERDILVSG